MCQWWQKFEVENIYCIIFFKNWFVFQVLKYISWFYLDICRFGDSCGMLAEASFCNSLPACLKWTADRGWASLLLSVLHKYEPACSFEMETRDWPQTEAAQSVEQWTCIDRGPKANKDRPTNSRLGKLILEKRGFLSDKTLDSGLQGTRITE